MSKILPEQNRLQWSDYFMTLALVTAQRSPDPNTHVGACIVDSMNRVVGLGYNGPPRGVDPEKIPWEREHPDGEAYTKYAYVAHAESNAIKNASKTEGCIMYVTLHPCNACAIEIIQVGIKKVYFLEDPYQAGWSSRVAKRLLRSANVLCHGHDWSNIEVVKKLIDNL